MKKFIHFLTISLLLSTPYTIQAKMSVFACEPEWASLAEEIGGEKITAFSATSARQDPHHIRARPSLIAKVRRADVLICSGAGLEVGWLPILLQKGSAKVQPGSLGFLMAAEQVPLLEKPVVIDRSLGDIHPEGNPHVHLNPHHILLIAKNLTNRLVKIDNINETFYRQRFQNFSKRWRQSIKEWETQASILKNQTVVVHHRSFSYLIDWLGLKQAASLEPKPGIPPTTSHLESLLQQFKSRPAMLIMRSPSDSDEASQWLADKTTMPAIILPYTVGGDEQSSDLFKLFDRTIRLLRDAYEH